MQQEMVKLQKLVQDQKNEAVSNENMSLSSDNKTAPVVKRRNLIAPITLKAAMLKKQNSPARKRDKKRLDDDWSSEDSSASNKKRKSMATGKKSKYVITSSTSESENDEVIIRHVKKKFKGTKETNSQMRKRLAIARKRNAASTVENTLVTNTTLVSENDNVTKSHRNMVIGNDNTGLAEETKDLHDRMVSDRIAHGKNDVDSTNVAHLKALNSLPKITAKVPKPKASSVIYDIPANKERPHTNQRKKLTKVKCESKEIINHRKAQGFRGEVLVLYTDGQRFWCFLHGAYQDIPNTVTSYLTENNLTFSDMGYMMENDPWLNGSATGSDQWNDPTDSCNPEQIDEIRETESKGDSCSNNTNPKVSQEHELTRLLPAGEEKGIDIATNEHLEIVVDDPSPLICGVNVSGPKELVELTLMEPIMEEEVNQSDSDYSDFACSEDHNNVHNFIPTDNSKYCINGCDFDGVHCANIDCNKLFVHTVKGTVNSFKPTSTRPLYSCRNRGERCPYALCFGCYYKFIETYKRKK